MTRFDERLHPATLSVRPARSESLSPRPVHTSQAVREVRRDLQQLKATVRRLSDDCDVIVEDTHVHQTDPAPSRSRGRNALHLQARADAIAALIQETERVLDRLDARPAHLG
jgi:hypothetical protein